MFRAGSTSVFSARGPSSVLGRCDSDVPEIGNRARARAERSGEGSCEFGWFRECRTQGGTIPGSGDARGSPAAVTISSEVPDLEP